MPCRFFVKFVAGLATQCPVKEKMATNRWVHLDKKTMGTHITREFIACARLLVHILRAGEELCLSREAGRVSIHNCVACRHACCLGAARLDERPMCKLTKP